MYYDEIKVDGNVPERSLFMRKFCLSQFIIIKKNSLLARHAKEGMFLSPG